GAGRTGDRKRRQTVSRARRHRHLIDSDWQVDPKGRSPAGPRLYLDVTARLLNDPVDRREAQPSSLALSFGREEGLEDALLRLVIHPRARVAHREEHVAARLHAR